MPSLFRDDNDVAISDPSALFADYAATGIAAGTSAVATAEVALPADFAAAASKAPNGKIMVRIANGANDAYYAFGAAGASGSFTAANMTMIPQRWIEYITIDPNVHKSLYILWVTAASIVQATVLR